MALARNLGKLGAQVIAIDRSIQLLNEIREDVDVNGCDYDETRERRRKRSRVATESGPGRVLGDLGEGDAHLVRADGPRALVGTHGCVEV